MQQKKHALIHRKLKPYQPSHFSLLHLL